ncbi:MAG: hypothetical protein DIU77_018450, partial [Thermocrispum agreste]
MKSLEDLITTGAMAAAFGPLRAAGVGILSVSGGACDVIADLGEDIGLQIPQLSESTTRRLEELLPSYAHPQNPLDVTGGALADPDVWRNGITAMAEEPEIGLFGVVTSLPKEGEPQRADTFRAVGEALARTGMPGVIFPQLEQEPTDTVRRAKQEAGVPLVLSGLERFVSSAAHLGRWSRWWRESTRYAPRDQQPGGGRPLQVPDGPLSEHDA